MEEVECPLLNLYLVSGTYNGPVTEILEPIIVKKVMNCCTKSGQLRMRKVCNSSMPAYKSSF